jgi:hypothetical protein
LQYTKFFEKILIPLLSAIIAGAAIYFSFRQEVNKIRDQRKNELKRGATSIILRVAYCESLAKYLISSKGSPDAVRLLDFQNKIVILLDDIFGYPEIALVLKNVISNTGRYNNILMLAECRARSFELTHDNKMDRLGFIYFTLLTLTYLFDNNKVLRDSAYEAMKEFTAPDAPHRDIYLEFLVKPREHPLEFWTL